ncbi:uncharacterized mitochondrial protein AtMg00810-like [Macadamia integrifolia]|uniref:uncharacterized mitochondrial protein AtMg00810-like n=1 Tax=Macadamia integrifolia TaxID=60698 RepID=UPI001C4EE355|nr:uncharacterized mitochondrial protein AtMg00810-like [Macadamia integrifolia]
MVDEFTALLCNGTWSLVPWSPSMNLVWCKWVYRIKRRKADGSIEHYNVQLVAKGFHQHLGLDYTDTFSFFVKPTMIRVVLALATPHSWPIWKLDVHSAFLHGKLTEKVFVVQPRGFEDLNRPEAVCHLHHSLSGSHITFILIYVDDVLVTGSSSAIIPWLFQKLATKFSIKDLGPLHFFLGIEAIHQMGGLLLSQSRYIGDLLHQVGMVDCKLVKTIMAITMKPSTNGGVPMVNPTQYRSIVWALKYVTLTSPNVSFAVNKACQFIHAPSKDNWKLVKRILRILKYTRAHGLLIERSPKLLLQAFTEADWVGNGDERRSTSGYSMCLGPNFISWISCKQKTVTHSSTESEYKAMAELPQN